MKFMNSCHAVNEARDELHALVIEDERICALILSEVLLMLGMRVTVVKSADEAISVLESERVDLITLDIRIEGDMDGWDLAERIRSSGTGLARVPIVAVTTCCFSSDYERSRALGLDRHVAKPFHVDQMLLVITQLLGERGILLDRATVGEVRAGRGAQFRVG